MNQVLNNMKINKEEAPSGFAHSMEISEEFMADVQENVVPKQAPPPRKTKQSNNPKNKSMSINKNVQNVLSDNTYNSLMGKPPF